MRPSRTQGTVSDVWFELNREKARAFAPVQLQPQTRRDAFPTVDPTLFLSS